MIKPKLKDRKICRGLVITILSRAILLLNFSAVIGVQAEVGSDEKEKQIPNAYCIYENREDKMKPFIYKSDDGEENMISYLTLVEI